MTAIRRDARLFRVGRRPAKDIVLFNWFFVPIDQFDLYADAYHKAGRTLADAFGRTGAPRDFQAAPIMFLYRQAFELYLKALILLGAPVLERRGMQVMTPRQVFEAKHRLTPLLEDFFTIVREVHLSLGLTTDDVDPVQQFRNLVRELEHIDPESFAFRYPTDRQGVGSLAAKFSFSVSGFADRLDPILEACSVNTMALREIQRQNLESIEGHDQ